MSLKNKRIIVTGCSSGIGAETCRQLKSQGATVIGFDLKAPTENVDTYIPIDLANDAAIQKAVASFSGGADALCNIAGVPPTLPPMIQLKVNFFGLRTFTNLIAPKLNDGASIVNLASMAGMKYMQNIPHLKTLFAMENQDTTEGFLKENNLFGEVTYNFSKEAVILWTMKMVNAWKDRGITIKCVSPGPIKTPILKDFMETIAKKQVILPEEYKGETPDIAGIVVFLCGEGGRWINGQNIVADGGLLATRMGKGMEL